MNKYKLSDLIIIKNGSDYKAYSNGNIPVYGTGGIMTYINKYCYDGQSILLPRKGSLKNIMFVDGKFWTVDTMYWTVINKSLVYPKFLFFYLSLLDLSHRNTGSALPSMTFDSYYSLEINLPTIEIQKKIGDSLFLFSQKIENNNKIITELESMAKIIYNYWFLQFDFPDEKGKPYKSSGGKMVYNEELKREIPKGWSVAKAKDICSITTGKEDANHSTINGKYSFFTCSNAILKCDDFKFDSNSVLIAGNGDFNVKHYCGKFNAYQRTYVLTPYNEVYISLLYMNSILAIDSFKKASNGSIVKFITLKNVQNIQMILPNKIEILKPFNDILNKIDLSKRENQELASLRDFLLPMLMNGQVTFKS